jgi:hypothetical protein
MVLSVLAVTVSWAEPVCPENAALMVEVPPATPVAVPRLPVVLETVATVLSEEVQSACSVMSCREPSEKVPIARNGWVPALVTVAVGGVTSMELSVGVGGGFGGSSEPGQPPSPQETTSNAISAGVLTAFRFMSIPFGSVRN